MRSHPTPAPHGDESALHKLRALATTKGIAPPCLVRSGLFGPPRVVPLKQLLLIGAASRADLRIEDPVVSALHCLICHFPDLKGRTARRKGWFLYDLDSENGTWLRGQRLEKPTPLSDGDCIQIGRTNLMLVLLGT